MPIPRFSSLYISVRGLPTVHEPATKKLSNTSVTTYRESTR
jgi:hypothetical protein